MAERLAAVESTRQRLLGDLGQEIRTPVATIMGYLEAAEDGVSVTDEDTIAVLRAQAERLARLAEDMLAVSQAEEQQLNLRPVPVSTSQIALSAVAAALPSTTFVITLPLDGQAS